MKNTLFILALLVLGGCARNEKQTPFMFQGKYATFSEDAKGYKQTLDIFVKKKSREYQVEFSASSIKGRANCHFSGVGHLKNDTIWVNIANKKDTEILMYIVPSKDNLGVEVFTKNYEERFQMMLYCGGGASLAGKYLKNKIRANYVGIFDDTMRIKDILQLIPTNQIQKKEGKGEFAEDSYDDYEIYTENGQHLLTLTPKNIDNLEQKINRVLIKSPFFETEKGISAKSTYKAIKEAYTINKIEPTREHIVLIIDELNANFGIAKTKLQQGWWNNTTKTVNADKIPDDAQIDSFILWWNE